jgi:hypothetical protein
VKSYDGERRVQEALFYEFSLERKRSLTPTLRRVTAMGLLRSIHEGARDMARDIAATDAYVISRRERKKVEMLLRPDTGDQFLLADHFAGAFDQSNQSVKGAIAEPHRLVALVEQEAPRCKKPIGRAHDRQL